ncbi:hypothetical protein B0H34DRAFT_732812 [Crassisporium funariophilum]|nr:hypothetical protein B0H34DRAFT_732812 [Crassisporium funariophilum]
MFPLICMLIILNFPHRLVLVLYPDINSSLLILTWRGAKGLKTQVPKQVRCNKMYLNVIRVEFLIYLTERTSCYCPRP